MAHSVMIATILIVSCCHVRVEGFHDMMEDVMSRSPECTVLLHKLERMDVNHISSSTLRSTLLVADEMMESNSKRAMQELLSARKSSCVLLFAQTSTMDESVVEYLLNRTKHRTVFVFMAKANETKIKFRPYFMDSVILFRILSSGNLLISKLVDSTNSKEKMLWRRNHKKMLSKGVDFTMHQNMDRITLRGKTVTLSIVATYPFTILLPNCKYTGLNIDILENVRNKLGFEYRYKEEEYLIRYDPRTQTFGGSIGSIANGSSHFALAWPTFSGFIKVPISNGPILYVVESNYLVPKTKPLRPFSNFVRPFTFTVWLCFLAAWLACSFTACLFNKYHGDKSLSLWKITFDFFGTIWQQNLKDASKSPHTFIFYILFGFWIVGMTFKGTAYSCNLRAFMVMKEYEKPLETDEDMVESGVTVFLARSIGIFELFQSSPSSAKREIAARTVERKALFYTSDVIGPGEERMIREGGTRVAIKVRNEFVLKAFETHFGYQPLQASKTSTAAQLCTYAMQMNQPWTDEVYDTLLRMLATGLVDFHWRKNFPPSQYDQDVTTGDPELEPYKLEHVAGPLVALATGLILSLVAACLEAAHFHVTCKLRHRVTRKRRDGLGAQGSKVVLRPFDKGSGVGHR